MTRCAAELCVNWTGQGCICSVLDLTPEVVEEEETMDQLTCDICDDTATFGVQPEDVDTKFACSKHLHLVAHAAIETWSEHGVICIGRAEDM